MDFPTSIICPDEAGKGSIPEMEWTQEEFSAAVTAHGRSVYRAARAVLDRDADAEDAVAQAVLQAWQSLDKLRDKGAVRPWLIKIAVNCAYAQRRKQAKLVYLEDAQVEPAAAEPPRESGLWDAVRALPPERRTAVVLFYYEDMSVEQIAKCLGVPAGTVKSRLSRARKQLREMLQEQEGAYGQL